MMNYNTSTLVRKMVMAGMLIALTIVGTMAIRIPVPATQGYVHIGDSMVIVAVIVLGWKWGALAGGIGEMLADLLSGYAQFAPITFVVKFVMAMIIGRAVQKYVQKPPIERKTADKVKLSILVILSGIWMVIGYYLAECLLYGSFIVPLVEIPANVIQFIGALIIGVALIAALMKTAAKKYLTYK